MLEPLKELIYRLNCLLTTEGLVVMTSGNVSGRDPETGYVVVKPSGVPVEELSPEDMIVTDVNEHIIEGDMKPSVDARTHLYIYRHRDDVFSIVHTHSNYATAFAANAMPIPVILTAHADQFGREIPVGAFAPIGEEDIGREVVRAIGDSRAIVMTNHGAFTIGKDPASAFKSAVMLEDIAKTTFLAMQLGQPKPIPEAMVKQLHHRYVTKYGQKKGS